MYAAAAALLPLALAALSAEIFLRIAHEKQRHRSQAQAEAYSYYRPARNPRLVYTYLPGKFGNNAQGYTGCDHAFQKPPNV